MANEKFNKAAKEMVDIMDKTVKIMERDREHGKDFEEWLEQQVKETEKKPDEEELRKALAELQIEAAEINDELAKLRDDIVYVNGIDKPVDGRRVAKLIDRYFECLRASQQLSILLAPYICN